MRGAYRTVGSELLILTPLKLLGRLAKTTAVSTTHANKSPPLEREDAHTRRAQRSFRLSLSFDTIAYSPGLAWVQL